MSRTIEIEKKKRWMLQGGGVGGKEGKSKDTKIAKNDFFFVFY